VNCGTASRCQPTGSTRLLAGGAIAGRLFMATFTVLGARKEGYDVRRDPVSLLAVGRQGWAQRTNFVAVGTLYLAAALGLAREPTRLAGSAVSPAVIAGVGIGLIGSGLFVPGPNQESPHRASAPAPSISREELLHNLCAVPIFIGIPAAAATSARGFSKRQQMAWARYSRCSAVLTATTFVLFSAAFNQAPTLRKWGGLLQRASIITGFGWLTAISLRARRIETSSN
jgi:hypothetical protein